LRGCLKTQNRGKSATLLIPRLRLGTHIFRASTRYLSGILAYNGGRASRSCIPGRSLGTRRKNVIHPTPAVYFSHRRHSVAQGHRCSCRALRLPCRQPFGSFRKEGQGEPRETAGLQKGFPPDGPLSGSRFSSHKRS
jgi:hypothetical protein